MRSVNKEKEKPPSPSQASHLLNKCKLLDPRPRFIRVWGVHRHSHNTGPQAPDERREELKAWHVAQQHALASLTAPFVSQVVRDGSGSVVDVPEGEAASFCTAGFEPDPEHSVVLCFDDRTQVLAKAETALVSCRGEGYCLLATLVVVVLLCLTAAGRAQHLAQKRGPTRRRHWCLLLVIGRGYFGCCRETGAP